MDQTRLESLIESTANIAIGFFISLAVWVWLVAPLYDIPVTHTQNVAITAIFTVSSLARSYVLRRFFNKGLNRMCSDLARRIKNEQ